MQASPGREMANNTTEDRRKEAEHALFVKEEDMARAKQTCDGVAVDGLLALVGADLINGTGREPVRESVILVEGSVIREAGGRAQVGIPAEATTVDVSGMTVMPGMIDCHVHISITTMDVGQRLRTRKTVELFQTVEMMKRTLNAGFTTVRDAGTLQDVGLRQAVEMGLVEGPRLVVAGSVVQTGGHFDFYYPHGVQLPFFGGERCDGVPEVRKAARKVLRQGFDCIKISTTGGSAYPGDSREFTEWSVEEVRTIVEEASARGKAVLAHASNAQGIKNALLGGVWSVEHGSALDDESIQMFLDRGTYLVPTLLPGQVLFEGGDGIPQAGVTHAQMKVRRLASIENFKRAVDAGLKIAVGTDALGEPTHGINARELELMVSYGFTPMEAIVAATKTASEVCRLDARVGTLEPGKLADLLVVDGSPLDDISILQDKSRLRMILKEGSIYTNTLAN
jgi:imidazolonepropionase-like amidohydrolase